MQPMSEQHTPTTLVGCPTGKAYATNAERELEMLRTAVSSVDYRVEDGDPFNAGWNAALDAIQKAYDNKERNQK